MFSRGGSQTWVSLAEREVPVRTARALSPCWIFEGRGTKKHQTQFNGPEGRLSHVMNCLFTDSSKLWTKLFVARSHRLDMDQRG